MNDSTLFEADVCAQMLLRSSARLPMWRRTTRGRSAFLQAHGYTGRVLPINPGREEIFGARAYPDLRAAPGPIDHAFIMVPAAAVPAVIDQCCELKIPVATIFSAGFAEIGPAGEEMQRDMVAMRALRACGSSVPIAWASSMCRARRH